MGRVSTCALLAGPHCEHFPQAQLHTSFLHPVLFLGVVHLQGIYLHVEGRANCSHSSSFYMFCCLQNLVIRGAESWNFLFFKLACVFKRNLCWPRSTFLLVMKLHIMFWCGIQAGTIFKPRNNCTCHLLTVLRDSEANSREVDGCFREHECTT